MNATMKIFLRTDQGNKDGYSSVCLRLTKKRKLKIFTLSVRVRPKDWNFKNNCVKKTDIEYFRKNKYLIKYENKAPNIIDKYFFKDKDFSATRIRLDKVNLQDNSKVLNLSNFEILAHLNCPTLNG